MAHSIFKRWRPLFRSNDLYTEINHVLSKFGKPYLELLQVSLPLPINYLFDWPLTSVEWQSVDQLIEQNKSNKLVLEQAFSNLNLMIKLFFDLSCHDLPPDFEDNLSDITALLHKYLLYDNSLLHTDDNSEAGLLEFVKAGIFEALILYIGQFEDAFGKHVGQFVGSSWNLLTTLGLETKYDILVSKALQFLTSVCRFQEHAANFNDEAILGQVVEKVILPNISLRESDIELFEDEPIEFIRRDLEGSDNDTRRRAATDFLRQLIEKFEERVTKVVSKYIDHYLADYARDQKSNWRSKDTAVYLFSSIAAKGVATMSHGVTNINPQVNIMDFFKNHLASDLVADNTIQPILKVDAIKYLHSFRSLITKEQWNEVLPLLVKRLGSNVYVVFTYAAIALERVLFLTDEGGQPIINTAAITPLSKDLLEHLFSLMEKDPAPEKIQENEFLMRCVMRVLIVIKDAVVPITDSVLSHFTNITNIICTNPSNPRFYYYHFEALGAFVRCVLNLSSRWYCFLTQFNQVCGSVTARETRTNTLCPLSCGTPEERRRYENLRCAEHKIS